jgi:hypothetical protein
MGSNYWRVEFIQPAKSGDDRCVMLHGQLEEIVGPMTIELAEAWIDRFDNQRAEQSAPEGQHAPDSKAKKKSAVAPARPRSSLPTTEPAG